MSSTLLEVAEATARPIRAVVGSDVSGRSSTALPKVVYREAAPNCTDVDGYAT